jgi:hypothetical protein
MVLVSVLVSVLISVLISVLLSRHYLCNNSNSKLILLSQHHHLPYFSSLVGSLSLLFLRIDTDLLLQGPGYTILSSPTVHLQIHLVLFHVVVDDDASLLLK